VYVYKWKDPAYARTKASATELHSLPKIKLEKSKKIHPGVSTFAEDVSSVGPDHLKGLMKVALDEVPEDKVSQTPIFLLATAGVRFLPKQQQSALLDGICTWLQTNTQFALPDCDRHIQVISGETEGLYGWLAANYLLGGFDHPQGEDQTLGQNHHHTYGFLDMGGASAQIAFAPNATEAAKHANDLELVRMRQLDGTPAEYRVFTTTWLGFGANKARDRYVETLQSHYDDYVDEIPDPCMPKGLRTTLDGDPDGVTSADGPTLVGTGKFEECLTKTYPLLGKDEPCDDDPCLLNGQHVPLIDFNINRFVGVSEYWHTTHGVFGGKNKAYDLETYQHEVIDYCSRDWDDIANGLDTRKKDPERKAQDAREACFKASWLINMLYEGIGIPRVGLETGFNNTIQDDPFRPVNEIDDVELSWTLGKMVLYASGQVPPQGTPLPVGFGPNMPSGSSSEFEEVGSVPSRLVGGDDDDDDDDFIRAPSNHMSGLIVIVVLLLVAGYLLRRPERRRKLWNLARGRRKSGSGRKPGRGFSLANKLFGRNPHSYERVMEEGEAIQFELDGVDSDEDHSDSSEGSRAGTASGLTTPKITADEGLAPTALDRQGLVVRTESRERLTPMGRRSRTGSPQRQKSSLMTSLEQD
jgi:golgi apyrase